MNMRKLKKLASKDGFITFKQYALLTSRLTNSVNKFPHVKYTKAAYERDRYRNKYD